MSDVKAFNAVRVVEQMQDSYLWMFGEHWFSSTHRIPQRWRDIGLAGALGRRARDYPTVKAKDGKPVVFVHIPKCGGTSIVKAMGLQGVPHKPAFVIEAADPSRFAKSYVFASIRRPAERILSIISHLTASVFATEVDRRRFSQFVGSAEHLVECSIKYLRSKSFRSRLLRGTHAARLGFTCNATEFLTIDKRLLVDAVFAIESMPSVETWLSSVLGRDISIAHMNRGLVRDAAVDLAELDRVCERYIPQDVEMFEGVKAAGGACLRGDAGFESLCRSLGLTQR